MEGEGKRGEGPVNTDNRRAAIEWQWGFNHYAKSNSL